MLFGTGLAKSISEGGIASILKRQADRAAAHTVQSFARGWVGVAAVCAGAAGGGGWCWRIRARLTETTVRSQPSEPAQRARLSCASSCLVAESKIGNWPDGIVVEGCSDADVERASAAAPIIVAGQRPRCIAPNTLRQSIRIKIRIFSNDWFLNFVGDVSDQSAKLLHPDIFLIFIRYTGNDIVILPMPSLRDSVAFRIFSASVLYIPASSPCVV